MGLKAGQSNRIGLGMKLGELSLKESLQGGSFRFKINGEEFHFTEENTIAEVLEAVNTSKAGVRMVYRAQNDTFVLEATESGTGKQISLSQEEGNLLNAFFGLNTTTGTKAYSRKLTYEVEVPKEGGKEGETVKETRTADGDTTLEQLGIEVYDKYAKLLDKGTKLSQLSEKTGGRYIFEDGRIRLGENYAPATDEEKAAMKDLFGVEAITLGDTPAGKSQEELTVQGQSLMEWSPSVAETTSPSTALTTMSAASPGSTTWWRAPSRMAAAIPTPSSKGSISRAASSITPTAM